MIPKFLYHGTSVRHLKDILDHGICPRGETGISKWTGQYVSRTDAVYLTSAYPLLFAQNSCQGKGDLIIFEIDTSTIDHSLLVADEDVLDQWLREEVTKATKHGYLNAEFVVEMITKDKHKMMEQVSAERSLAALGTCGYLNSIDLSSISRYLTLTQKAAMALVYTGMDPTITVINYTLFGKEYEIAMDWLFNNQDLNKGVLSDSITRHKLHKLGMTITVNSFYEQNLATKEMQDE